MLSLYVIVDFIHSSVVKIRTVRQSACVTTEACYFQPLSTKRPIKTVIYEHLQLELPHAGYYFATIILLEVTSAIDEGKNTSVAH